MEQLSGLDAMFIHTEGQGLPMHISTFSVYDPDTAIDGQVALDDILEVFERTTERIPILRSRLVKVPFNLDQPYWDVCDDFDIHAHVHRIALPSPGDWQELQKLVGHLHAQVLNRDIPLWEAYIIEGVGKATKTSKNSFAIFMKVHHAIMDGATGMAIFSCLHTLTPYSEPIMQAQSDEQETLPAPSSSNVLSRAVWNNSKKGFKFGKLLGKAIPAYRKIKNSIENNELSLIEDKPRTRFNQPISTLRNIDRFFCDFEDIRRIKKLVPGATVNEVALTLVGGAMRKYLEQKDELPNNTLVASVPINTRSETDANQHGNVLSIMNVAMCTDIEDPVERLRHVHQASDNSKAFADAMGSELLNDVCDTLYSGLASWGMNKAANSPLMGLLPPVTHTVVTNVSGPPIAFYFAGCKMVDSFGLGPLLPNMGPFHTITSSNGRFCISVTACGELMSDISTYTEGFESTFKALLKAADVAEKPKQASRKVAARKTTSKKTTDKKAAKPRAAAKKKTAKAAVSNVKKAKAPAKKAVKPAKLEVTAEAMPPAQNAANSNVESLFSA